VSADVVPVSVVVPTIGRPKLLAQCLQSVTACRPRAAEVLVVDQSHDPEVARVVDGFAPAGVRLVPCAGLGVSRGRNMGLRAAANEVVLVTDDDCTVAPDWVGVAWAGMRPDPQKIVSGPVFPAGDPRAVPSTREETPERDFTGRLRIDLLSPNNMALNRRLALAEGGFDERFSPREKAEDGDFCYRWLKAGRRMEFEPRLVVWHHEWRTPDQLERLYVEYMRGVGFLYAKHLRRGDLRILRYLCQTLVAGARGMAAGVVKRRPRWMDPRRGTFRGLPVGLWLGFRVYWLGGGGLRYGAAAREAAAEVRQPPNP
jgi:GT2 family glycosyltransferase